MEEFKVNEYIKLKLEDGNTNIYVGGELFNQCKYILLKKSVYELKDFLENIESVDELAEYLDHSLERVEPEVIDIPAKTRFWIHCSNMQAWAENNYDSRLLHRNLAFPLLKRLYKLKDYKAIKQLQLEIQKRWKTGDLKIIEFLDLERYLRFLNKEKIIDLMQNQNINLIEIFEKFSEKLLSSFGEEIHFDLFDFINYYQEIF